MATYKPPLPFNIPIKLLQPIKVGNPYGVNTNTYPNPNDVSDDFIFFGSFRTFGGTESKSNDVLTIINTAVIDTWYRPDIKSNCQICLLETGEIYDIISTPENIGMMNTYLQFKVQSHGGDV